MKGSLYRQEAVLALEAKLAIVEKERDDLRLRVESVEAACREDAEISTKKSARMTARSEAVERAAEALRARLDFVHGNSIYMGVWEIAQLHRGPYRGPTYIAELEALASALALPESITLGLGPVCAGRA
jgi:hypothetical protein